jgi:hypothetical protein
MGLARNNGVNLRIISNLFASIGVLNSGFLVFLVDFHQLLSVFNIDSSSLQFFLYEKVRIFLVLDEFVIRVQDCEAG